MKLTESYFFPIVTEEGAVELYHFAESVLFKAGRNIPPQDYEDIKQEMVLACLSKLSKFDQSRGIPLGGYLYWQCRGALKTWCRKRVREIPCAEPHIEARLDKFRID